MSSHQKTFIFIVILSVISALIALPPTVVTQFSGQNSPFSKELKLGLDIQGGMQVVLAAQMDEIDLADRSSAIESARDVILRRVDLFGISEPVVTTSTVGDNYRLLIDLPGVTNTNQALQLVGTTAQLDFRLLNADQIDPTATTSATAYLNQFSLTDLTGQDLKRATVQFDQQTGQPVIALEFNESGRFKFAKLTTDHVGEILGIFLDDFPLALPKISTTIVDGRAIMTGDFQLEEAKQLAIQLNAGALPVPIEIIEQRQLGASLGQAAIVKSVRAGLVGLGLVMIYMVLLYGWQGVIADMALVVYGLITIAIYKLLGVTLTLPGIAGLLLTIGMAVDANILIFERLKEELRLGKPFSRAMELGFGRAWDSIKDANVATIMTALVLYNPLDFSFLNTSGLVRGFGLTLLIGVLISLFTGVVVTRNLMRLFLKEKGVKL